MAIWPVKYVKYSVQKWMDPKIILVLFLCQNINLNTTLEVQEICDKLHFVEILNSVCLIISISSWQNRILWTGIYIILHF